MQRRLTGLLRRFTVLDFWRSVGLAFHFEILRISPFHRPTPHGAFTSFSPAKIRSLAMTGRESEK